MKKIKTIPLNNGSMEDELVEKIQSRIKKHQTRLYIVGACAVLVTAGTFFYRNYMHKSDRSTQEDMMQAVFSFEEGNFSTALHGNEAAYGFVELAKRQCSAKTKCLINFYAALCHFHLKDYDAAIEVLTTLAFSDFIMQGRALALIGDAHSEKGDYANAILYYEKAATSKPNQALSPQYLCKAARVHEHLGDRQRALGCYQTIAEKYPDFDKNTITKHIERLR